MRSSPSSVIVVGMADAASGFGRVTRHIIRALAPAYRVHTYLHGAPGGASDASTAQLEHHAPRCHGGDRYGVRELARIINQIGPRFVLFIHDLPFIRYQLQVRRLLERRVPLVAHAALDGAVHKRRKLISTLACLDLCVWLTDFAREHVAQVCAEQPSLLPRPLAQAVIGHGVDTRVFRPIPDARAQAFPQLPAGAFVVMNANRASSRKRLDLTLEGFAAFARDKPAAVYLYLHLPRAPAWTRAQVERDAARLGIGNRLMLGEGTVDEQHLARIYSACDVGVNTSEGEGWGLVSCEHGATGVAQIVPAHTSHPEIWGDAALYLDAGQPRGGRAEPVWRRPIEPGRLSHALERLYVEPRLREQMAQRARARMSHPAFSWDAVEAQWRDRLTRFDARQQRDVG